MSSKSEYGFTLIELMVTVAIAAVLLGIGVPSFTSALKNSRMSSDTSALIGALFLARSESVKRSGFVTVCARASDTGCGTDWNNGWLVFSDNNINAGDTAGVVNNGEEVLRIGPELDGRTVTNTGSLNPNPATTAHGAARPFIRYNSRGSNNWSGGTFTLCDDRGEKSARAINLVLTGDIRKGRENASNGAPLNVYGNTVTCP